MPAYLIREVSQTDDSTIIYLDDVTVESKKRSFYYNHYSSVEYAIIDASIVEEHCREIGIDIDKLRGTPILEQDIHEGWGETEDGTGKLAELIERLLGSED